MSDLKDEADEIFLMIEKELEVLRKDLKKIDEKMSILEDKIKEYKSECI